MSSFREGRSFVRWLRAVFPLRLVIFLFAVAGSWRAPPWLPARSTDGATAWTLPGGEHCSQKPQRTLRRSNGRANMKHKGPLWAPSMPSAQQLRGGASGGSKAQEVSTTEPVVSWGTKAMAPNETRQKGKGEMTSTRQKAGAVSGTLCRLVEGCTWDATSGDQGSDMRLLCARHKQPHHVDDKHKTCASPGQPLAPIFRALGNQACILRTIQPRAKDCASGAGN